MHGRLSIEEASSFFEKVQLHFQLANLLIQFVLLGVGLLADLLAAIAENIGQTSRGFFLPTPNLRWMDTKHLRSLGHRLMRLDRFHRHFRLQARRVILSRLRH